MVPRRLSVLPSFAVLGLLLLAGCSCGDPCDGVVCEAGETCEAGACTDTPDGGLPDAGSGEVTCHTDLDCAGVSGRTHCDGLTGTCVQCWLAAHCPSPETQICSDANRCVSRPPCRTDDDCADLPASPYCETTAGSCVACTDDAHCPGLQRRCGGTFTCRFDACAEDADCAEYPGMSHCDARTGYCRGCTEDGHCGEGEFCNNGSCVAGGECQRDGDCAPGERCHTLLERCVGCVTYLDCTLGGRCLGFECQAVVPCQGDVDCGPLQHCDATRGACVECTAGAHCAAGQTCDETGRCAAPETCGPASYCRPGAACLDGVCDEVECSEDAFAPNVAPYQAAGLSPGSHPGLTLCPNTWDWFVLDAKQGDGLRVSVAYDRAAGDPTVLVWVGTGTEPLLVGEPVLTDDGQTLEVAGLPQKGPVWVGLRGVNATVSYDLTAEVLPGGLCADDAFEPNDAPLAATPLPEPVSGVSAVEATGCVGDEDWYRITVPADLRLVALASPQDGEPATSLLVSVFVREDDGVLRLVAGAGTNRAEAPARAESTAFLIRVVHTTAGGRPYRLTATLRPPRPVNDGCAGAASLTEGAWVEGTTAGAADDGATGCGGDGSPDVVHGFTLAEPRTVTLTAEGTVDTVLGLRAACDDPATEVACHDQAGDREVLEAILPAGEWTVWVDGYAGREGAYRLRMDTGEAPAAPAGETCALGAVLDPAAGGGVETGELALAADDLTAGCGLAGGDAVYLLELTEAASLIASLEGRPGLSLELRGECADAATAAGCEVVPEGGAAALDLPYLPAGTWALVVDGGGALGGAFTLTWGLGSAVPPPANEECASAERLDLATGAAQAAGNTRSALDDLAPVCASPGSGGDVVYVVGLTETRALRASLTAGFDAVLELRGAACADPAASLACSDLAAPTVFAPALAPGDYHLVVDGYAGGAGPFTLDVALEPPRQVPAGDLCAAAELLDLSSGAATVQGSTWLAAADLDPGSGCTGSPAAGPDVFYAVDLAAGQTLTATVTPEAGYDAAIYVLDGCGGACLAGADAFFVSEPETVGWTATAAGRVILGIDGWREGVAGDFELTATVQ